MSMLNYIPKCNVSETVGYTPQIVMVDWFHSSSYKSVFCSPACLLTFFYHVRKS